MILYLRGTYIYVIVSRVCNVYITSAYELVIPKIADREMEKNSRIYITFHVIGDINYARR